MLKTLAPALALILSSCTFITLQRNVNEMEQSFAAHGNVLSSYKNNHDILIIAYKTSANGHEITTFQRLDHTGQYLLILPADADYYIAAFADVNGNLRYDRGEAVGYYGAPDTVHAQAGKTTQNLDITLATDNFLAEYLPADLNAVTKDSLQTVPIAWGDITDLQNAKFSRQTAKQSLWAPMDFARRNGIGIYFGEEYDAHKTPVLFIHGAAGTPLDWKYLLKDLDRDCYQPWFFYYPTGARLNTSTKLLSGVLDYLKNEYHFNSMVITGHSIGGLIARAHIIDTMNEKHQNDVKLFVSISTPWNGHHAAVEGVQHAPAVIPLWRDLQPDSEFLQSLFARSIGKQITSYLFFSYSVNENAFEPEHDGSVTLASQLYYPAQQDADKVIGFEANHIDILKNKNLLAAYHKLLTDFADAQCMKSH